MRGGPWTAPLGVPADLQTPPLSPRSGLWLREGHAGRGLLRVPLCALLRHAGVGSRGQVQPPSPLPCRRSSCGWGRPPGPGGAEGRACGSPAGVGAGGGRGGGRHPARSRACVGGGGGGWGGAFGPLAMPPVGQRGGAAAWRSRPRGPVIGQGGRALPPPPSTGSRILTQSLPGAPHPPAVAARRWPAGGGREGQRSVVSGLRGRFPWVGNKAGVPWCRAVHGGRGHPYHSGSRPPGFSGHDLRGVPVRRRGPTCSSRPPFEPAAGAWGRVTLRLPSRAGGVHPFCLGGWGPGPPWLAGRWGGGGGGVAPRPPCSRSRRRPVAILPGSLRVAGALPSGARVRSGLKCRPGVGGVRGGPWTAPLGAPSDLKPSLCHLGAGCGYGRVMWGAASFLLRCARCSGTPVWVRGSRPSRRCPHRAAVPPEGGAPPRPWGGGGPRLWLPCCGGCGGGGVGGPPPRPPSRNNMETEIANRGKSQPLSLTHPPPDSGPCVSTYKRQKWLSPP